MTRNQIQRRLREIFSRHLGVSSSVTGGLVPQTVTEGKLYEAHVLSYVIEHLAQDEGFSLSLVGGTKIRLKSSPGPINRSYPRFDLRRSGIFIAELWTDIEFLSLSYCNRVSSGLTKGDYHELDIVIIPPGTTGRPRYDEIWLGVECKNTGYEKDLLRGILGVRREMSFLRELQSTKFRSCPRTTVPALPPSCLLVYSTDPNVVDYAKPGEVFGINFIHQPM